MITLRTEKVIEEMYWPMNKKHISAHPPITYEYTRRTLLNDYGYIKSEYADENMAAAKEALDKVLAANPKLKDEYYLHLFRKEQAETRIIQVLETKFKIM